jgi:hypothetical protein
MDPQSTWKQLLSAYTDGDWDLIEELANELLHWLDRGGFPPKVIDHPELDDWNRALTKAGCQHALETVQGRWSVRT